MKSAEKDFDNQMDKIIIQPLSLATHLIVQWAHEQTGNGGSDGDQISNVNFYLPR